MIVLDELFKAQSGLDSRIASEHHVTYENTREKRIMALIVEIGELANTTRCFKYWSNKGMEAKEVILDEYADGLHFFLSLGIDIKTKKTKYRSTKHKNDLTQQFHLVYQNIKSFHLHQRDKYYIKAFQSFLNLMPLIGFKWEDLEEAYYKKLKVNYQRQDNNY